MILILTLYVIALMMGIGYEGITCVNCGERFVRASREVGQYCSEACRPLTEDEEVSE